MITNLKPHDQLSGLARSKTRDFDLKTIPQQDVDIAVNDGWSVDKAGGRTCRMRRPKQHGRWLEDRLWALLYRLQFSTMSGEGGSLVSIDGKASDSPTSQVDVVALDEEVAVAVECKSSVSGGKRTQFQEEIGKFALVKKPFTTAISKTIGSVQKRNFALIYAYSGFSLSANDRERAQHNGIVLLDEHDIAYYESLALHLGPAAKYQFLADIFPGKVIDGLQITVPALKSRMGSRNCYTFSISPEYLLKLSFVSHRARGRASDVDAYQRLLVKQRLKKLREYISKDGVFPTNIVVNFEPNRLEFSRMEQLEGATGGATAGWLKIRPAYKSAWIIDGQHRLFAYSGHPRASTSSLSVLAFDGLEAAQQAKLFIDINAEQKRVKPSLLVELYAELHSNSNDPNKRLRAIISKSLQSMSEDADSPFHSRLLLAENEKTLIRCITLVTVFEAALKAKLHILREKDGVPIEYGPLWDPDAAATMKRTAAVLNAWFGEIAIRAEDWWNIGAGEGGGLAMNDTVAACIAVLGSVCQHLHSRRLVGMTTGEVIRELQPYSQALGDYLGSFDQQQRKGFRDLRGAQGKDGRMRTCQAAIRLAVPSFSPPGLDDYLERERAATNSSAREIIAAFESKLQRLVIGELKRAFGGTDTGWWVKGVPQKIRLDVSTLFEGDDGKRGGKEHYFNLIHYKKIASDHWEVFKDLLGNRSLGASKDKQLSWLDFLNERRKEVFHASGVNMRFEDLNQLVEYAEWFEDLQRNILELNASEDGLDDPD